MSSILVVHGVWYVKLSFFTYAWRGFKWPLVGVFFPQLYIHILYRILPFDGFLRKWMLKNGLNMWCFCYFLRSLFRIQINLLLIFVFHKVFLIICYLFVTFTILHNPQQRYTMTFLYFLTDIRCYIFWRFERLMKRID